MSDSIFDRYRIFQKVSTGNSGAGLPSAFLKIQNTIEHELPALLNTCPPNDILVHQANLVGLLGQLKHYCLFPKLSSKKIIAVGGRFSAGKSSFINRLLGGEKLLSTDVNPTTSVPTYLLQGEGGAYAQNILGKTVALSNPEIAQLVHDDDGFGGAVSRLLSSLHIEQENFPWANLALLDTPGYSKPEDQQEMVSDNNIAKQQLNTADFILWLVSADDGVMTEEDIVFLSNLHSHIPKLILLNKSDKRSTEDIQDITALIKETLQKRNINVLDVLPVSSRKNAQYDLNAVTQYFQGWDGLSTANPLAINFKMAWLALNGFYQAQINHSRNQLADTQRLALLVDDAKQAEYVDAIQAITQQKLNALLAVEEQLNEHKVLFFTLLNQLGEQVGLDLTEPSDLAIMQLNPSHGFAQVLESLCRDKGITPQDYSPYFTLLNANAPMGNLDTILRRDSYRFIPLLEELSIQQNVQPIIGVLRKVSTETVSRLVTVFNELAEKKKHDQHQ